MGVARRRSGLAFMLIVALALMTLSLPASVGAQAQDRYRIAFVPMLIGIPYFTAMEQGGKLAAERFGVEFVYTGDTEVSAMRQVQIIDNLIRQQFDAIAVAVVDSASINPVIRRGKQRGIVMLTSDSDSPTSDRDVFVAQALDQDLGFLLIDRLALQIGGAGKIGIVSGESTATNLNSWIHYMQQRVAEAYPDIEIVDIRYTQGGSSEEALRQALELMTRYPDLKGLVAVASTTIPGVAQAIQQAGKVGQVAMIGYGSPNTVRPYIKAGIMKESILWNPVDLGYLTVWAAIELIEGRGFQEVNHVPGLEQPIRYFADQGILLLGDPLIIDAGNVDDFDF